LKKEFRYGRDNTKPAFPVSELIATAEMSGLLAPHPNPIPNLLVESKRFESFSYDDASAHYTG
jgi:hypothetical protein